MSGLGELSDTLNTPWDIELVSRPAGLPGGVPLFELSLTAFDSGEIMMSLSSYVAAPLPATTALRTQPSGWATRGPSVRYRR